MGDRPSESQPTATQPVASPTVVRPADELSDETLDSVVGGVTVAAALARVAAIDPGFPGR